MDGGFAELVFQVAVFFEGRIAMRRRVELGGKPSKTSSLRIARLLYYDFLSILARGSFQE